MHESTRKQQYAQECDQDADAVGRMVAAQADAYALITVAYRKDAWQRQMHNLYRTYCETYYRLLVRKRAAAARWRGEARKAVQP